MTPTRTFTVEPLEASSSTRLDVFLAAKLAGLSRSAIKNMFSKGLITIGGRPRKPGCKIRPGDEVRVSISTLDEKAEGPRPEAIPLEILYEDDDVIVVNKPAGLCVHPGAGRKNGTLVNALLAHTQTLSRANAPERPGIVHRLDKDTGGALVTAKTDAAYERLARQFKEHSARRRYVALVWGRVEKDSDDIDISIGRDRKHRQKISPRTDAPREAVTRFNVVARYRYFTLLELTLKTGRTHQVRVHLSAINHPVVGDPVYGRKKPPDKLSKPVHDEIKKIKRQMLHAKTLGFVHPSTGEYLEFSSLIPDDMRALIGIISAEG
ncbi:MAG: RluA family pseudouridine synthase [Deltaproteobacteria bacterium]|nr:RluA family pseudouridine synthase [Deltaproteobacteria bacterium]